MKYAVLLLFAVSACTQFPPLEGTISPELQKADYPALRPLGELVQTEPRAQQAEETLARRAAALAAKAKRLRERDLDE